MCRTTVVSTFVLVISAIAYHSSGNSAKTAPLAPQEAVLSADTSKAAGVALRRFIASAKLENLRWADFGDVSGDAAEFYQVRDYTPAWVDGTGPTSQAKVVVSILQEAANKGLNPEDYDGSKWQGRAEALAGAPTPEAIAKFDLAITVCMLRYVSALDVGRINPKHLKFDLDLNHRRTDLAQFLGQISQATDIAPLLDQVEPQEEGYMRSAQALRTYISLAQQDNGVKLPIPEKPVTPGGSYAGMALLVAKLTLVGDLPQSASLPEGSTKYEGDVVEAVKRFQLRHALPETGSLGLETVKQLNVPLADRVRQLQYSLERWRVVSPRSRYAIDCRKRAGFSSLRIRRATPRRLENECSSWQGHALGNARVYWKHDLLSFPARLGRPAQYCTPRNCSAARKGSLISRQERIRPTRSQRQSLERRQCHSGGDSTASRGKALCPAAPWPEECIRRCEIHVPERVHGLLA